MMTSLVERQTEIAEKLEEAKHRAGVDLLEGRKPDYAAITELGHEQAAIESAKAEEAKRQRAAIEARGDEEHLARQSRLCALVSEHLADIEIAQEAASMASVRFAQMLARLPEMATLFREITGQRAPVCLNEMELARTLACRLAATMRGALPQKYQARLGEMKLHPGVRKSTEDWHEADRAEFHRHLAVALGGETDAS